MKITILGTRGEIEASSPEHKKHSGILVDDILFDLGVEEFIKTNPKTIFVTHAHPDHLTITTAYEIPLFGPEEVIQAAKKLGWKENLLHLLKLNPYRVNKLIVTPIPTIHSKKVHSVGYLIESNKLRVFYSSDMIWIRKRHHDKIRDLDLVITDGSFIREGGMVRRDKETGEIYGHQGIPNLIKFFSKLGAKRIVFVHLGTWMIEDPKKGKEEIRKFSNDTKVEAAVDGIEINLEEEAKMGVTTTEEIEPIIPKVIAKISPKTGIYLVRPHAEMIMTGQKTLIIKSKKFTSHINEPLFLLEDKVCRGIITLKEPQEISYEEFIKLRDKHQISDKEVESWSWDKKGPFYAYEFRIDEKFEPPIPVRIPKGVQVFVGAKNIKFLDLKSLTILDLFEYRDTTDSDELYSELSEELYSRNLEHSQIFELIKGWIEDYDVKAPNGRQLGDDFRIVLGWYSSIRRGKKLFKRVGEEKKEITLQDCKDLALKIFNEMVKRGFTFNRPETYKKYARELFEWIISQVGEENVPFKEKEEKAFLDPAKIKREDFEKIDPEYTKTLTDAQLIALDRRLHLLFREIGKVTEPLENAHIFVWNEMKKRRIPHTINDGLTRATFLEVEEYPAPKLSNEEMTRLIKLQEVLDAFPKTVTIDEPIHVYLCGGVVNKLAIPDTHDIDILFKQGWLHKPTMNTFLDKVAENNTDIARRLHFVWDPKGPQIGLSVPLYRLSFVKVREEEMKRRSPFEFLAQLQPQLFKPHIGMKPKSGFGKFEYWDPQELWDKWAKKFIDKGIIIQKKYDGLRFQIHCKGNQIKIITEDRQRDRANVFKNSVKELLANKKADSFIIDAEMVEYYCGQIKTKNYEEICEPIEREEMIKWIAAKEEKLDDEFIVFHVHDCVFLNGTSIADRPYEERWAAVDKVFPSDLVHWRKVPGDKAEDMREFFKQVKKFRSLRGSEGVVCKAADSSYKIKFSGEARTEEWAKLKNLKEIDVMVWRIIQKKARTGELLPQYMYECAFSIPCGTVEKYREEDLIKKDGKCYLKIGRSYATAEKVKIGDIVIVRPIRIAEFKDKKGKLYYSVAPDRVLPIKDVEGIHLLTAEELWERIPGLVLVIGENQCKVVNGIQTLSWDGKEGKWSNLKGISRHWTSGRLVKLSQRVGSVEVTPGHSLLDENLNPFKPEENPILFGVRKIPEEGTLDSIEIELPGYKKEGKKLFLIPSGKPWQKENYSSSKKYVLGSYKGETLKALLRILGAYTAAGSASKNQTSWRVRISNQDRRWLESLGQDLQLISNSKVNWEQTKKGKTWNLVVWSKPFYDLVVKLCGEGARSKTVPPWLFFLRPDLRKEFFQVLSAGDGTLGKGLTSVSPKLLTAMCLEYAMRGQDFSFSFNERASQLRPVKYHTRLKKLKRHISFRKYEGWTYDLQTSEGNFLDGIGLILCKNTWMFPYYSGKHPVKTEPDSIDVVKKLVAASTGPLPEKLSALVFKLPTCPFWRDENICPLKSRFLIPRDQPKQELSTTIKIEHLKFPIVCRFANHFKCRYVKPYYYGFKEIIIQSEVDEDTGEEINEDKS